MNKRITKKVSDRKVYPKGKIKKNIENKIYIPTKDMPNRMWIFWYSDDGRVCHHGLYKEEVLEILEDGDYEGVIDFVITDLDLRVIAKYGRYAPKPKVKGRMGLVYRRVIDLKTKRAYDLGLTPIWDELDEEDNKFIYLLEHML